MSTDRRQLALRLVAEALLIFVSILMALAVDRWREEVDRDALRTQAVAQIRDEIRVNLQQVEGALPYHEQILEAFDAAGGEAGSAGRPTMEVLAALAPRGLQPPVLSSTAWETAIATEAVALFDFGTSNLLARLYRTQAIGIERTTDRIVDRLFEGETFEPSRTTVRLMLMRMLLGELIGQERTLVDQYRLVLAELDAVSAPSD